LFISVTAGFGPLDEMASFRYDHFVHQLSDFTANQDQILKTFEIVKTIAVTQPATVPQGSVSPKVPLIMRILLAELFGGIGSSPAEQTAKPPTETLPTVKPRVVPTSRVLYDALYDAAKALETRPKDRRKIIFIVSDGQVSGQTTHTFDEITRLLLRDDI